MTKKEVKKEVVSVDSELSYDTKTLITVITLIFIYPVGLILMFIWMKWNGWIKFLIVLPIILAVVLPLLFLFLMIVLGVKMFHEPERVRVFKDEIFREISISPTTMVTPTVLYIKK